MNDLRKEIDELICSLIESDNEETIKYYYSTILIKVDKLKQLKDKSLKE